MKKLIPAYLLLLLLSCQGDDDLSRNPFLVDLSFQTVVNTDLPQYSSLNFANNSVVLPGEGIRGIVIYHAGNDQFFSYELSDPNHVPSFCSTMNVNGITASCNCSDDDNSYYITSGEHITDTNKFPMKSYRVVRSGNNVIVSN